MTNFRDVSVSEIGKKLSRGERGKAAHANQST
jgi:hypothetical protein